MAWRRSRRCGTPSTPRTPLGASCGSWGHDSNRQRGRVRRAPVGAAGCAAAEDAVRYGRLARGAGFNAFVKLEVIGDQETLLPDVQGLLQAAATLVRDGFTVLAYTNEDLVTALRLEDAGVAAVMPLA